MWPFIWTKLNPLHSKMISQILLFGCHLPIMHGTWHGPLFEELWIPFIKGYFVLSWPSESGEDENDKSLQKCDIRTTDQKSPDELKRRHSHSLSVCHLCILMLISTYFELLNDYDRIYFCLRDNTCTCIYMYMCICQTEVWIYHKVLPTSLVFTYRHILFLLPTLEVSWM